MTMQMRVFPFSIYSALHRDASPGIGGVPPLLPTLQGLGGTWVNVSPRPPFLGSTQGNVSPVCRVRFPKRGASRHPPSKRGMLGCAPPLDFLPITLKKMHKAFQRLKYIWISHLTCKVQTMCSGWMYRTSQWDWLLDAQFVFSFHCPLLIYFCNFWVLTLDIDDLRPTESLTRHSLQFLSNFNLLFQTSVYTIFLSTI